MSKKDKKKGQELPPIQKYQNENMIEDLSGKVKVEETEVDRLKGQLMSMSTDIYKKGQEYIKGTQSVEKALEEKAKQNAFLNQEITQIRQDREDFEAECKKNFEEKFKVVEAEQKAIVAKVNEEMEKVKEDLTKQKTKKKDLKAKVEKLTAEVRRLNNVNIITIQNYENKIKDLNEQYHLKLKATTEIFENFLKNNQELLTTDLYSVYRRLKLKFDTKIKECLDYKVKNEKLVDQNKLFRLSMDNNDEIINECAKVQVEHKKKNKMHQEEVEIKTKMISRIKDEYQKQVDELNEKCTALINESDEEIRQLKNQLAIKSKELEELRTASQNAIKQRSEIELFFIEALKEVKKDIIAQRKREIDRRNNGLFPYLNVSSSYSSGNTNTSKKDDSIYVTSLKKVDIKDMDPESKEKILRALLNKINEGKQSKNFVKLKQLVI